MKLQQLDPHVPIGDTQNTGGSLHMTPEEAEFWGQCFEAIVSIGEAEDVWSEYVAGPGRTAATVAVTDITSDVWRSPDLNVARAPSRLSNHIARRVPATLGQGNADEDYS